MPNLCILLFFSLSLFHSLSFSFFFIVPFHLFFTVTNDTVRIITTSNQASTTAVFP